MNIARVVATTSPARGRARRLRPARATRRPRRRGQPHRRQERVDDRRVGSSWGNMHADGTYQCIPGTFSCDGNTLRKTVCSVGACLGRKATAPSTPTVP
jgi:hypothetical protein